MEGAPRPEAPTGSTPVAAEAAVRAEVVTVAVTARGRAPGEAEVAASPPVAVTGAPAAPVGAPEES